ncbi:hypothetical protein HIM_11207 [Hirsutella minnesotensis 3608]|uniref:NACHT-NTPase and P-loop NTPases N-terminal domain-containing protein n=1 Tax=Hirsutella minnesotensis 3608 TaxID=1043627 RepID=A0A0F7ZFM3_9HYPO|nr:hypothetical protein HIM_11207 [Hirsutella minnesotensis 3608]
MSVKTVLTLFLGLAAASVPYYRQEYSQSNNERIISYTLAVCHDGNTHFKCDAEDYSHCKPNFRDDLQAQCKVMKDKIKRVQEQQGNFWKKHLFATESLDSHNGPYSRILHLRCCEDKEAADAEAQMTTLQTTLNAVDIFQKDAKTQLKELLDPNIGANPVERVATVAKRLQTGITKLRSGIKLTKSFAEEIQKDLKGHEVLQGGAEELAKVLTDADDALKPVQHVTQVVKQTAKTLDVVNRKDIQGAIDEAVDMAGELVGMAEDLPDFFGGMFDKLGDKAKAYLKAKKGV